FTSESKEAIADYDEIQKEITLALRECGRRLGLFLRRRERAASEYRRRNIFELYIEEVVEACDRLKGGRLPKEKLKAQLQKIATSRTGGVKTDEALGKTSTGPEGLPHSIIVTAEGVEGEVDLANQVQADVAPAAMPVETDLLGDQKPAVKGTKAKAKKPRAEEGRDAKPPKGKVAQMALFAEKPAADKKPTKKSAKPVKPGPRRKK
ncbi:MAG: DNA topoisomerase VI subunit B, partial [Nitrospirae bacterium]|nr:DNA topoisomerase VI subunit B [Nitrospirota bacterium]